MSHVQIDKFFFCNYLVCNRPMPYKQGVRGSSPLAPTKKTLFSILKMRFFVCVTTQVLPFYLFCAQIAHNSSDYLELVHRSPFWDLGNFGPRFVAKLGEDWHQSIICPESDDLGARTV